MDLRKKGSMLLLVQGNRCTQACKVNHSRGFWDAGTDLVVAQPHSVVCDAEGDHMVMEGLALRVALWGGKHVRQHLLQQLEMRLLIKGLHVRLSHFALSAPISRTIKDLQWTRSKSSLVQIVNVA